MEARLAKRLSPEVMESETRVQILEETASQRTNVPRKGIHSTLSTTSYGEIEGQTGFFNLG